MANERENLAIQGQNIGPGQAAFNRQQTAKGLPASSARLEDTRGAATSPASRPPLPPPTPSPVRPHNALADFFLRFGGSSLNEFRFNQAQTQLKQLEVQQAVRQQRAVQGLPEFQAKVPELTKFIKDAVKAERAADPHAIPGQGTLQKGIELYNANVPPERRWTQQNSDTWALTPQGGAALVHMGILPPQEAMKAQQKAKDSLIASYQKQAEKIRQGLQPDDLFQLRGGPRELGPTPSGQPLQQELVASPLLRQLTPPGLTPEETQTLLAGKQGEIRTRPDGTQETRPIREPISFGSGNMALLESMNKALQVSAEAEAKVPSQLALKKAEAQSSAAEGRRERAFKERQQANRNRATRVEKDKDRKLKVNLQKSGHTQKQAIVELEKRLALSNRQEILKQQAEIDLNASIKNWEEKQAFGQMTFGQKVVLQDLQNLSAMERIDAKAAHDKVKYAQTHGGDGAARDALKYLVKSGKVDMKKLAKEMGKDRKLSAILSDILVDSVDENFNALGQRILQITGTDDSPTIKQSQLQSLQEEFRQGGYPVNSKERQEIQAAWDLQNEGKRDPHAGTRAANTAVTSALRSSGVEKFNPVTGEFQMESLTPGNVNWGKAIKRLQVMADTDPKLAPFLQPQIDSFRAQHEATGQRAKAFEVIEQSVIQNQDRKLPATDAEGNPLEITMGEAMDLLQDYDINSDEPPPEIFYEHNGIDWFMTVNNNGEVEMSTFVDGEDHSRVLRGTGSKRNWR
jgi:hypothetical protein